MTPKKEWGAIRTAAHRLVTHITETKDVEETSTDLAPSIDHTLLKPGIPSERYQQLCNEARHHHFAAVCIPLSAVPVAAPLLEGTPVRIASVVGFPLGTTPLEIKRREIAWALDQGANEIDAVVDLGNLRNNDREGVTLELSALRECSGRHILKVIIETPILEEQEIIDLTELCLDHGIDIVKTGTGFFGRVTLDDVALINATAQGRVGIKAAGGISSAEQAEQLIRAGATRLGCSRSISIVHPAD
ncbi:MAG: deoxyribose-phosphate aldolase [Synergistales bacterium]|nr:deoxyribose-phosphate aldolase [Synergistales bacterium]